jgi:hypothetical protein
VGELSPPPRNSRLGKAACLQKTLLYNLNCRKTFNVLQVVFGGQIMGRTQVFKCFSNFKSGMSEGICPWKQNGHNQ